MFVSFSVLHILTWILKKPKPESCKITIWKSGWKQFKSYKNNLSGWPQKNEWFQIRSVCSHCRRPQVKLIWVTITQVPPYQAKKLLSIFILQVLIWAEVLLPDELRAVLVAMATAGRACVDSQSPPVNTGSRRVHREAV